MPTKPSNEASVKLNELLDEYLQHVKQNQYKSASVIEMVVKKVQQAPEFTNRKVAYRAVSIRTPYPAVVT